MGLAYNVYLEGARIYGGNRCKTHLAVHEEIVSRVSDAALALPPRYSFLALLSLLLLVPKADINH